MLKLSKTPEIELNWGMQTSENREKWIDWVFQNLCLVNTCKEMSSDELKKLASELFDSIQQCGYEEGYDSAKCDSEAGGL